MYKKIWKLQIHWRAALHSTWNNNIFKFRLADYFLGGHHFLWNRGVMNFRKYLGNIFVTPLFEDQKFYDPPFGATMLKKHVTPMRVAQKICIFGAISLNKIFIKICSHPKISWFFCDPPISHEKILWPPSFFMAPPIRKKMIAPLLPYDKRCVISHWMTSLKNCGNCESPRFTES